MMSALAEFRTDLGALADEIAAVEGVIQEEAWLIARNQIDELGKYMCGWDVDARKTEAAVHQSTAQTMASLLDSAGVPPREIERMRAALGSFAAQIRLEELERALRIRVDPGTGAVRRLDGR